MLGEVKNQRLAVSTPVFESWVKGKGIKNKK
jgi:hypothetical protein